MWDPPALPIDIWMWAPKQPKAAQVPLSPPQTACEANALTQQVAQCDESRAGRVQQADAAMPAAHAPEWTAGMPILGSAPAFPESMEAGHARYTTALQAIADRHAGLNVLVVTHGEAVRRSVNRLVRTWIASCTACQLSLPARAGLEEMHPLKRGGSVPLQMPWAVVYEVQPCGFTVAWRDRAADGEWDDGWVMGEQDSGRGVAWVA